MNNPIKVEIIVNVSPEKAWTLFTEPEHIKQWNSASPDWHTPQVENDVRVGGRFRSRMEAKDGSAGFDFAGVYTEVIPNERFAYTMDDGRKVEVRFEKEGEGIRIVEDFEPEAENPPEFQQVGWQTILDNFKKYTEEAV
jgi:uncharacterized protein YndB with AHSA1/START domain